MIKLKNSKSWAVMRLALDKVHGKYEESFQLLFNWRAEIEKKFLGSFVEIDLQNIGKVCLKRIFFCSKTMCRWILGRL